MAPTATKQTERPALRADARRNREAILEAARQGFAEHGFDCQMEDIAAGARVGVGTVYRHFPNKEALLDALVADRFETWRRVPRRHWSTRTPGRPSVT